MRSRAIATPLLLVAVLAGCSNGGGRWAGSVSDSAGVTMVSNPAAGVWEPGQAWTLEEELRIGSIEGEPEFQFGQVGGIAVGSDGRIYVLDMQAQRVQVYESTGDYVMSIGGPGGGPGELGQMVVAAGAIAILMGPGDTLLVTDPANQRVNLYGPDGGSLGSFRLPLEDGVPVAFHGTPSGVIAKQVRPFALPNQSRLESPTDAIIRLTASGELVDTLMKFPSGETLRFGGGLPEITMFAAEPVWALMDDGRLLFGINDSYRLSVYDTGGQLERVVTKEAKRQPVSQPDQEAILGSMERQWERFGVPANIIAQMRDRITFEEFFPAFASIWNGPDGTIWVRHILQPSELSEEERATYDPQVDAGAADWDVFDSEGRYLGVVTMPKRFSPVQLHEDDIYGVWRDELDVQYVVRMGLHRPAGSEAATD